MTIYKQSLSGKIFSIVALAEAVTWGGLLLGMYFKYVTGTTDILVWWFGRLHGAAFILYVGVTCITAWRLRWPLAYTVLALLAAIPPLVTLPLEIVYRKKGLLKAPD